MAGRKIAGEAMNDNEKIIELAALGLESATILKRLGRQDTQPERIDKFRTNHAAEIAVRAKELRAEGVCIPKKTRKGERQCPQ